MHSNPYTFMFAAGISVVTAILLAVSAEGLRPRQEANIALEKKTNILRAVRETATDRRTIEQLYGERIQARVVDASGDLIEGVDPFEVVLKDELEKPVDQRRLPLYVYTGADGRMYYIVPMHGVGLWGPIWGYLSLEDDFNTVYGAYFDHKGETPGLGAEIAELPFQQQFQGKKIMDDNDQFISVHVVKPATQSGVAAKHRVDGISGGTITSRGADVMVKNWLQLYLPYFQKTKKS